MAKEIDPFEAAMASLIKKVDENPEENITHSDADPFAKGTDALGDLDLPSDDGSAESKSDPFETAMAALDAAKETDGKPAGDVSDIRVADDPFAAALQVAKSQHSVERAQKQGIFPDQQIDLDFLMEIKMTLTFEVGRTKMIIANLLSLGQGSIIELNRLVGEELELYVNGQLLATGEVVVINEKFGARIAKILSREERISRLGPTMG